MSIAERLNQSAKLISANREALERIDAQRRALASRFEQRYVTRPKDRIA